VDTGQGCTYRGDVSSPGEQSRPDEGGGAPAPYGPTPFDDPRGGRSDLPPYVYNPYANVSYPSTYPAAPAGLGAVDEARPVRRPGTMHLALLLHVVAALPYLLVGFLAMFGAPEAVATLPAEQLAQLQQLGVDPEQTIRSMGLLILAVAAVFLLLAILAWTGRGWARALLAAMTTGFVLLVFAFVAAAGGQGVGMNGATLVVLAGPVVLAAAGVVLMFGSAARAWFSRPRR
jgi:hypothetical protein